MNAARPPVARPPRDPRRHDERGLAAPVVVTLAGALLVLALLGGGLGRLLADQRRAAAAADLSALAAATALQHGHDPCASAAATARDNDSHLLACQVDGPEVVVRTAVSWHPAGLPGRLFGQVGVEAEARAGPVS